jgi:ribosome-associated protein
MPSLRVNRTVTIPEDELTLRFTTSGGPGGQHANKSSTRVEVVWNIDTSDAIGPRQRTRLKGVLRHRIDSHGNLRVAADTHRSQLRNREEALARLAGLVAEALIPPKQRKATEPTRAARERRLQTKKRRGETKRSRAVRWDD